MLWIRRSAFPDTSLVVMLMSLWCKKINLTVLYMNFFATVNVVEVLAVLLRTVDTTHYLRTLFLNSLCSNMEAKVVVCEEEDGGREDFNQQVI